MGTVKDLAVWAARTTLVGVEELVEYFWPLPPTAVQAAAMRHAADALVDRESEEEVGEPFSVGTCTWCWKPYAECEGRHDISPLFDMMTSAPGDAPVVAERPESAATAAAASEDSGHQTLKPLKSDAAKCSWCPVNDGWPCQQNCPRIDVARLGPDDRDTVWLDREGDTWECQYGKWFWRSRRDGMERIGRLPDLDESGFPHPMYGPFTEVLTETSAPTPRGAVGSSAPATPPDSVGADHPNVPEQAGSQHGITPGGGETPPTSPAAGQPAFNWESVNWSLIGDALATGLGERREALPEVAQALRLTADFIDDLVVFFPT